jgi:excinuclease ABC subunit B
LSQTQQAFIFPAVHYVADEDTVERAVRTINEELENQVIKLKNGGNLLEAQRLAARTKYDIEMLQEVGFCPGIENYSRPLSGRPAGSTPQTLFNFFPDDYLLFVDESHATVPQVRGMFAGDHSRKTTLVEHGFRLPSALDNRPLKFDEWEQKVKQAIFVSATPGPYELGRTGGEFVEQVIRPTGLIDPVCEVRPVESQVDDLLAECHATIKKKYRVLVTTLTKRMA